MSRDYLSAFVVALSFSLACSPESGSGSAPGDVKAGTGGATSSGGQHSGGTPSGGAQDDIHVGSLGGETGAGVGGELTEGEICATSSAVSELTPLHLLFFLDNTASMGDTQEARVRLWDPVIAALQSFWGADSSAGLSASLTLFPDNANPTAGSGDSIYHISCDWETYAMPTVPSTDLPNADPLTAAVTMASPPNEWGSPLGIAMEGSAEQARWYKKKGIKPVVIFVTDGGVSGCEDDGLNSTETEYLAGTLSEEFPIYIIGVGEALAIADRIAAAAGTEMAIRVDKSNPDATREDLLRSVDGIQESQISCELPVPAPPEGEELDPTRVNVRLQAEEEASTLGYNEACKGGAGWRYDDPQNPQMIELCDGACTEVRGRAGGSVTVVFGCETKLAVVR